MKIDPFLVAVRAKGFSRLLNRSRSIAKRYGITPVQMDRALQQYSGLLLRFDCGATFPITAVTLKRHLDLISKFLGQNIEFAVHGYTHVDYARLTPEMQSAHLSKAEKVFNSLGSKPAGFRSPYLSRNDHLHAVIETAGFSYVSNQPFLWNVLDPNTFSDSILCNFERALVFYDPWQSKERASVPCLVNHLVEIPVSLPDDEILIDRLGGSSSLVEETWLAILAQSYERGEMFNLQLHPERIALCADGLSAVLTEARSLTPRVWFARLDEIATWWKARTNAITQVTALENGVYSIAVTGPAGTTFLVRSIDTMTPTIPWKDDYRAVVGQRLTFRAFPHPIIGVSPATSVALLHFLQQQGYILEISQQPDQYSYYFDQEYYDQRLQCEIINQIEGTHRPLIRLGRWPNGAQSALAITGDIDALTLWDYCLRMVGK